MNTMGWRFDLNIFKTIEAIAPSIARKVIAPMTIILVGAATAPLSAQVISIENQGFDTAPTSANNSIIYTNPLPTPVNNSIIYGSPIPSPSITYPYNSYSYPSYYPGWVTKVRGSRRTTLTNPVLVNPTIRDSTLINPTIIEIQPQRRYRVRERNTTILRPMNY